MEFVHKPYQEGETIAAIATPPGEGGIAVVRISGDDALNVAARVFSGPVHSYLSHTAHFGQIRNEKGELVDEVLLLVMRAPKSYTGEETVEIQCHGGTLISRRVLQTILKAGARAARPGEFTFKAFMNGKLDLVQAEAVQQLISAQSELALQSAEQQLQGTLSCLIRSFQEQLVDIAATLEALVDFPDEGLEFASLQEMIATLVAVKERMERLYASFEQGKIIHEGLSLCLAGPPNVGKSSLMNALSRKERAIVTPIAGTTRDLLEEEVRLGQLHFRLIDTAGIRATEEVIEQEGIARSKRAMADADLILLVLDISRALNDQEKQLIASAPAEKTILIWNKSDLTPFPQPAVEAAAVAFTSAKEGTGIEELCHLIEKVIWKKGPPSKEEVTLTSQRHKQALEEAISASERLITGLKSDISPEFLSSDMRQILVELGTIIGTNVTEDILSAIFSKFCIGK